jgi:hypothetical protein
VIGSVETERRRPTRRVEDTIDLCANSHLDASWCDRLTRSRGPADEEAEAVTEVDPVTLYIAPTRDRSEPLRLSYVFSVNPGVAPPGGKYLGRIEDDRAQPSVVFIEHRRSHDDRVSIVGRIDLMPASPPLCETAALTLIGWIHPRGSISVSPELDFPMSSSG